ncbi:thiamine pyrophosphate-dependent dehydrogenase E1 component subunit alpha [Novosphingobium sp. M1R2S20]|uniref:Thiamine pyrophosphate-dependent dehydrogenase E1 component subunit alpha n=1 Tax=Novosphingobium rhizovicinum TaxID=3228928 RepID=A0ABV3R730_9SPHN
MHELSSELLLTIFDKMSLLKQNDERMRATISSGRLVMPYYSYRGQEAIPATISALLRSDDTICTIYRGTHDSLAKGCPLDQLWAELGGRATGTCKGKGGPMHITHPASGVMVTTGIVGSSMPIANGLAWAAKLEGSDAVTVAYFGDGASNIGAFHESLNLASLWKLPVLFVCSNNRYSEHTKFEVGTAIDSVAKRAAAYSMPGMQIDGNDVLEIHDAASEAIARARAGEGPTLIEAMTFRYHGHVFGDNDAYMDEGEKAARMQSDPYPRFRSLLIEQGHAEEAQLAEIEAANAQRIEAAIGFALDSPFPSAREVAIDVYAQEVFE